MEERFPFLHVVLREILDLYTSNDMMGKARNDTKNEYKRSLQLCCLFADVARVIRFVLCPL